MNHLVSHTRDILVYATKNRLLYTIPLYFEKEKDYFLRHSVQIEIDTVKREVFLRGFGDLKPCKVESPSDLLAKHNETLR